MTPAERTRVADIRGAVAAIHAHLERGDLTDGLVIDAVRIRLFEIGEAVRALSPGLLATQPQVQWKHLARGPFDTPRPVLRATVDLDLPDLEAATRAMEQS